MSLMSTILLLDMLPDIVSKVYILSIFLVKEKQKNLLLFIDTEIHLIKNGFRPVRC